MTRFLLIRHATHALGGGILAGRMAGVHLSELGRRQAVELADRIQHLPIKAIYSSPLERTRETAQPLSERVGLPVQIREELNELAYGQFQGKSMTELETMAGWRHWNIARSTARIPDGESALETQVRVVALMQQLHTQHPDDCIALFSHGDVVKSAVAHFLGVHLELFTRIEIGLASVSVVTMADDGVRVLCVNNTAQPTVE